METNLSHLKQFRSELYQSLGWRADATMDLLDALSSNATARSVVELSLSPAFRRRHASVHDAIDALLSNPGHSPCDNPRRDVEGRLRRAVASTLGPPAARAFWLFALDSLPYARPHALTLKDRGYVYRAGGGGGGAPVTVGHAYSLLTALPEKASGAPPWAPPLSSRRIPTGRRVSDVAVEQAWDLTADPQLPWAGELAVVVADSNYGNAPFLSEVAGEANLVTLTRVRSNRVLYRAPAPRTEGQRGRGAIYGARFDLKDKTSWKKPDAELTLARTSAGGRSIEVEIQSWENLRMRGTRTDPMGAHPFTLLRVCSRDEAGRKLYRRPLWLVLVGARRGEVSAEAAHEAYRQRFDQEHAHRFLRQRLLWDAFQTPVTQHEENWVSLVGLAYSQLFAARNLAHQLPRPWEKATLREGVASPTMVQRDFTRILRATGTPARAPKPRGKARGRATGTCPPRRKRRPVVCKARAPA